MLSQKCNEALGGGSGRVLLEVVVAAIVGEIHYTFHHERVEALGPMHMHERAEGRSLHLEAERLTHVLGHERPDSGVLEHLVPAAHRRDMDLEGQHGSGWRQVRQAIAMLYQDTLSTQPPLLG
jgi:hypothetical protein